MHTQAAYRSILDHPWRIAALLGIVANLVVNYASSAGMYHSMNVADTSDRYASLFTPAGYAFSIWGVIYGSTLVYAVAALLPSQWDVRMHDRVAPWLLLTNVLAGVWLALFTSEALGPSVLVILAMLIATGLAYSIASEHLASEHLSRRWRAPFSLWLGWLALASLANLSIALVAAWGSDSFFGGQVFTCLLLLAAATFALLVNAAASDPIVPLVIAWGATAIAVARWEEATLVAVVAALVAIKAVLWTITTLVFKFFPIPARYQRAADKALHYDPSHPEGL